MYKITCDVTKVSAQDAPLTFRRRQVNQNRQLSAAITTTTPRAMAAISRRAWGQRAPNRPRSPSARRRGRDRLCSRRRRGKGDHVVRAGGKEQALTRARRGEVVRRRPDSHLLANASADRIKAVQHPLWPIVPDRLAATIGGPPIHEFHSRCSAAGYRVTRTAMISVVQGR